MPTDPPDVAELRALLEITPGYACNRLRANAGKLHAALRAVLAAYDAVVKERDAAVEDRDIARGLLERVAKAYAAMPRQRGEDGDEPDLPAEFEYYHAHEAIVEHLGPIKMGTP